MSDIQNIDTTNSKNTEKDLFKDIISSPINTIKDPETQKKIEKYIKEDKDNKDKKTKQYIWRFELSQLTYDNNNEKFPKDWTFDEKKEYLLEKIDDLYWQTWTRDLILKIKRKIIWLYYYIKGDIKEDYTRDLDNKILELISKNLPNYKTWGYPHDLNEKKWDLIKAKLTKLSKILLIDDYDYQIFDRYSMEWEIDGIKLRYWLISEEEYKKKMEESMAEKHKLEKEFQKLLSEYLFNLWD